MFSDGPLDAELGAQAELRIRPFGRSHSIRASFSHCDQDHNRLCGIAQTGHPHFGKLGVQAESLGTASSPANL